MVYRSCLQDEGQGAGAYRLLHPLQTELLPRCGEVEPVGKVVQEDGRVLLIAVLEVRWSRWGLDGGAVAVAAVAAALLGTLSLGFPELSDSVSFLFKCLKVVRVTGGPAGSQKAAFTCLMQCG